MNPSLNTPSSTPKQAFTEQPVKHTLRTFLKIVFKCLPQHLKNLQLSPYLGSEMEGLSHRSWVGASNVWAGPSNLSLDARSPSVRLLYSSYTEQQFLEHLQDIAILATAFRVDYVRGTWARWLALLEDSAQVQRIDRMRMTQLHHNLDSLGKGAAT